jgi:large subunit ribosomal protein L21
MYAVLRTGGKQYCVEPGSLLEVEKLPGEIGDTLEFDEVLLLANGDDIKVGQPLVSGAKVAAKILSQSRGEKKIIYKKIRRHGKKLKKGHRQSLTKIEVKEISAK